jgi:hypothetical protein
MYSTYFFRNIGENMNPTWNLVIPDNAVIHCAKYDGPEHTATITFSYPQENEVFVAVFKEFKNHKNLIKVEPLAA